MIASAIIAKFELYVGDTTELSSADELDLLNKVYFRVADDKTLEIFKKNRTGTMTTTTTIALPDDFSNLVENYNWTDNAFSTEIGQKPVVVWINNSPIYVVNWSDRRQYLNNANYCYLDIAANLIRFPYAQPSSATYDFDYKYVPAALTANDSPVFPARFHDVLYHGMCVDDMVTQLFDKARSYADWNQAQYNDYLKRLALWNANLLNM